jgi:hypothetical protein
LIPACAPDEEHAEEDQDRRGDVCDDFHEEPPALYTISLAFSSFGDN